MEVWMVLVTVHWGLIINFVNAQDEIENSIDCRPKFDNHMTDCMSSFLTMHDSYELIKSKASFYKVVTKHLCHEYERMLVCLHRALTKCPSNYTRQKIQKKLGHQWVQSVNEMCDVYIKSSMNEQQKEYDYLSHQKSAASALTSAVQKEMERLQKKLYENIYKEVLMRLEQHEFQKNIRNQLSFVQKDEKTSKDSHRKTDERTQLKKKLNSRRKDLKLKNSLGNNGVQIRHQNSNDSTIVNNIISYQTSIENLYFSSGSWLILGYNNLLFMTNAMLLCLKFVI